MAAVPIYVWNGTAWQETGPTIPVSPIKYQASAPSSPSTGDIWVDSDGDVTSGSTQLQRFRFVASGGETSLSGNDANGATLAYTAGMEQVVLNGAVLVRGHDYTATNGTSITGLSPALVANDVVEVFSFMAFNVANTYTQSQVDGLVAAAPGLKLIIPSAVTVGTGTGSIGANGQVTFTGASSIAFNNVFSSTYDSYKIILNVTSSSGSPSIRFRFRSGGTPNTATAYAYGHTKNAYTTSNSADGGYTTSFAWAYYGVTPTTGSFDVHAPFLNQYTGMVGQLQTSADFWSAGYKHTVTASYDGFEFYPDSGTITGLIQIYGYKD